MTPISSFIFPLLVAVAASSPLLLRDDNLGLRFADPSGCSPGQVTGVMNAIADARTITQRAISALKNPDQNPAAYFFPSSGAQGAIDVLNVVLEATLPSIQLPTDPSGGLNPIQLTCQDPEVSSLCDSPAPDNNGGLTATRLGYVPESSNPRPGFGTAQIVICPAMFELPRTPAPCSGTPGLANLGWGFLRTFVTLRSVQTGFDRLARDAIGDRVAGVEGAHSLLDNGSAMNADNYAELATWSNDIGVEDTNTQCLDAWPAAWS